MLAQKWWVIDLSGPKLIHRIVNPQKPALIELVGYDGKHLIIIGKWSNVIHWLEQFLRQTKWIELLESNGRHTFSSSTRRLDSRLSSIETWSNASHTAQGSASPLVGSQEGNKIFRKSTAWDVWKYDSRIKTQTIDSLPAQIFPAYSHRVPPMHYVHTRRHFYSQPSRVQDHRMIIYAFSA